MNCLRCGKATEENQVFCAGCLRFMETHPVKPGTAIHLPHRNEPAAPRKQVLKRKTPSSEEQVAQLKNQCRKLVLALIAVTAALGLCAGALFYCLTHPDTPPAQGRNYTTDTTQG